MSFRLPNSNARLQESPKAFIAQIGTGGCITKETSFLLYIPITYLTNYIEIQNHNKPLTVEFESPSKQLNYIREVFEFNISELASILEITRPTMYAWLQGKPLRPDALSKIAILVNSAKQVAALEIKQIHNFLHRPIFNDFSLYDKLKNNDNIAESLKFIKEISEKEATAQLENKGSSKNKGSTEIKDYTKPFYRE